MEEFRNNNNVSENNVGNNNNNAVEKAENAMHDNQMQGKKPLEVLLERETERVQNEERLKAEREKTLSKAERQKAKAVFLREKMREKAEQKERKARLKAEREKGSAGENSSGGKRGGWLAAVISLGVTTLVLSGALTFTLLMPSKSDGMLENVYNKSFYDTVERVDNIDLNLSKMLSTADEEAMQKYLVDVAINSELAESELQQLPLHDESKFYTTKLINQIGDYAKYINNKLIEGETLNEQDYKGLNQLYKANKTLKDSLHKTVNEMGVDYSFSTLIDGGEGNLMISNFNELQNLSVEYPELIYDGPFSDGQTDREIKGLSGDDVDKMRALEIFNKIFATHKIEGAKNVGVADGKIACFNVQGEINGENLFAQISKKGGKLIMFDYAGSCKDTNITRDRAVEIGEQFLSTLGIEDMSPVWINLANNVYTINFAFEQDGVIVYSDLIKVRICAETEMVIGMEASAYYTNHTKRFVSSPTISEAEARAKVSKNIEIDSVRECIVPIGTNSEKHAYEIMGNYDQTTYYVYIDVMTGKQIEMFMVIDSLGGQMLI